MVTFFKNGAAERESACAEKNPFLFSFSLDTIFLLTLRFTNSSNLHLSIQSDNNIIYTEYWVQGKKFKREEPWFSMNVLGVNPMELNKTLVLSNKLIKVKLPLWKIWNADVSSIYGPLPFALMKSSHPMKG